MEKIAATSILVVLIVVVCMLPACTINNKQLNHFGGDWGVIGENRAGAEDEAEMVASVSSTVPETFSPGRDMPKIKQFKAASLVLNNNDSALYTFVVKGATKVQLIEAGNTLKDIDNPTGATLNGTATGLPASAIAVDDSGNFIAVLIASNEGGIVKEELTLSLAADLIPAGQAGPTDNQTGQHKPQWGPLTYAPFTSTQYTRSAHIPSYAECPSGCNCLTSSEATSLGYTQKCLDEPCFYAQNEPERYCYKPTPGWCCANQQVSQSIKRDCIRIGGQWFLNQYEAEQACQPAGFCCLNYQVYYPVTEDQCRQRGGSYWSKNQGEVMAHCQPPCYCCLNGQVYETTEAQCARSGGTCYDSLSQAYERCQPACWCCLNGQVYQTTQPQCTQLGGACYASQTEAQARCRSQGETYPPTQLR